MARIENAKGRRENQAPSGYTRLFGIKELGQLMSRIQGTVISSGTELEKLIYERATTKYQTLTSLSPKLYIRKKLVFGYPANSKSKIQKLFIQNTSQILWLLTLSLANVMSLK